MSSGNYTHVTRADGTVLTAAIYNLDHINHITNQNPLMTGGYQDSVPQKQVMSNPGPVGGEVLATSLAGELEQIRFQLKAIIGDAQWYSVPPTTLVSLANPATATVVNKYPGLVPGGRLTLTQGDPVMNAGGTGNIVYYSPYEHAFVPIWDGTQFLVIEFGEVSQSSTDATKSPAATVADKIYDIFAWVDTPPTPPGGPAVNRISRGPPWVSDVERGPGTDLVRKQGIWLNKALITNGPAAERGTYLGTVRTINTNQFCCTYGGVAAGGSPSIVYMWNAYNRIVIPIIVGNSSVWNPVNTAQWQAANGSGNFRIWFLRGLSIGGISADFATKYFLASGTNPTIGFSIGIDSIVNPATTPVTSTATQLGLILHMHGTAQITNVAIGAHFLQALEWINVDASAFYGGDLYTNLEW